MIEKHIKSGMRSALILLGRLSVWKRIASLRKLNIRYLLGMMAMLICTLALPEPIQASEGLASWYSTEACQWNKDPKCPTASGRSLYDLEREGILFAAAWGYEMGTSIEVCRGSKCVRAVVLDRGPNRRLKNRVVDLSKSAFQQLGSLSEGLIPVTVEVI